MIDDLIGSIFWAVAYVTFYFGWLLLILLGVVIGGGLAYWFFAAVKASF